MTGPDDRQRLRVRIAGVVQGVGFRPFVYRLAARLGTAGWVRNTSAGVELEVEAAPRTLEEFLAGLRREAPPAARIDRLDAEHVAPRGAAGFDIRESGGVAADAALISPDVATCADCVRELRDPDDRRHRYPFVNCTNCGPRFTIVREVPYDRARTTMRPFDLCPDCAGEYVRPADRRYHAEPNACPDCGPSLALLGPQGEERARGDAALGAARDLLAEGWTLAVKGLGGFHLACDATSAEAVARLRRRKGRPHKPLAVMFRDLETLGAHAVADDVEVAELSGPRRPILLVRRRESPAAGVAPIAAEVAPGHGDLGAMLPYTPLHHLLLEPGAPSCLVMTSGNRSEEPIVVGNDEAVAGLEGIADAFLVHDREIWNRCDDSVGYVLRLDSPPGVPGGPRPGGPPRPLVLLRRARGFVPLPVELPRAVPPTLAVGAMLSATFCLAEGRRAFLSQHIGDLDDEKALAFLRESIAKLRRWLGIDPEVVACDLHPDLPSTHLAQDVAAGRRLVRVQHHEAHLAAALAAAGIDGDAQGLALDGTGWGPDGAIWGGELLVRSGAAIRRAGHLRYLPLPGGDAAIRRPWRTAVAWLHAMVPDAAEAPLDLWRRAAPDELDVVRRMVDRGFHVPPTSSVGRLFDAVAALLGVRDEIGYEGQAAIELEQRARAGDAARAPRLELAVAGTAEGSIWDPAPLFRGLLDGLRDGVPTADLAAAFHVGLAEGLATACVRVRDAGGPGLVALCGGVFQNRILTARVAAALSRAGLEPLVPGLVPVNDGGISLGQVVRAGEAEQGLAAGG